MVDKKKEQEGKLKKKTRRKEFPTEEAFFDYQVKYWEERREDYLQNRDKRRAKKQETAEKMVGRLKRMAEKDPELATMIAQLAAAKTDKG